MARPTWTPRRASSRSILPALLGASFVVLGALGAPRTASADAVDDLVDRYHAVSGRHDDATYAAQRTAVETLADLRTDRARKAIRSLLAEERGGGPKEGGAGRGVASGTDVRRVIFLLQALVRGGGPAELDEAIRVAEADRDGVVTASLAHILAATTDEAGRAHLRGPLLVRTTPPVKAQVARALGAMADKEAVVPLLAALREDVLEVRAEALFALGEIRDEAAFPSVAPFLGGADPRIRDVAARALGLLGCPRAVPALVKALQDPAPRVVESAATALGLLGAARAVPDLIDRLKASKGQDLRVEDALEAALARITGVDLGTDADLWRAWWQENRDRAAADVAHPNAPTTVSGPRYYGFAVRSSRVVFVVDVSRSMGWNGRLDTAKKELHQVIEHLPASTRFDLISYSDVASAWAEKTVPATPENVRRALRAVDRLEPQNATNIHDALRLAFREEDADTIYFLSDGTPTAGALVEPEAILADLREANRWRRVRIHTVALLQGEPPAAFAGQEDAAASASFMRRLAAENDGQFREVR